MIEVEHLTVRFGEAVAVDDVSFRVAEGESFGLVGESGSGKSTVLRTMVKLNRNWDGRIAIAGRDVRQSSQRALSDAVQMVFQDPYASLHPRYTIGQQVAEPMRIKRLPNADARCAESCWRWSVSTHASSSVFRTSSPAGSASASPSRGP